MRDVHDVDAGKSRRMRRGLAIAAGVAIAGIAIVATSVSGAAKHHNRHPNSVAAAARHPVTSKAWTTLPTGHYLEVVDAIPGAKITSVIGVGNAKTLCNCAGPGAPDGDDTYQEIQITSDLGGFVFKVNVAGAWHPTSGTPVTVNGTTGYYDRFLLHPEIPRHPVHPRVALAWQYAPNSWATVGSTTETPIPLATAEKLAKLIRIELGAVLPDPLPQDS